MSLLRTSTALLLLLTLLTGAAYPLVVTGLARAAPGEGFGRRITRGATVLGFEQVGQAFTRPDYFWSRPSATAGFAYNALLSGGSNLGPTNETLAAQVTARAASLRAADPGNGAAIPVDLVTASGSGLDPHISPAAAYFQSGRVARARHTTKAHVDALVTELIEPRLWGVLGEPRVNVLRLNAALDARY